MTPPLLSFQMPLKLLELLELRPKLEYLSFVQQSIELKLVLEQLVQLWLAPLKEMLEVLPMLHLPHLLQLAV